ncbi:hypothetical protein ACQ4PT_035015 [Festuca glaucescens]
MAGAAPADEDGSRKKAKQGGFKTMPFILANEVCDRFATAGFNANMITYLTQQLHLPLVEASNLLTNFMGTAAFTPVFGAIIADSYAGRYWTIACGGVLYQLGMLGLVLSALIPSLPPRDVQQYRVRRRTVPARQRRAASRALPVAALHRARVRRHPAVRGGVRRGPVRRGWEAPRWRAEVELLQLLLLHHGARRAAGTDGGGVHPGERRLGLGVRDPGHRHVRLRAVVRGRVPSLRQGQARRKPLREAGPRHRRGDQEEEGDSAGERRHAVPEQGAGRSHRRRREAAPHQPAQVLGSSGYSDNDRCR